VVKNQSQSLDENFVMVTVKGWPNTWLNVRIFKLSVFWRDIRPFNLVSGQGPILKKAGVPSLLDNRCIPIYKLVCHVAEKYLTILGFITTLYPAVTNFSASQH
jgi:hypothetical protein